MTRAHTLMLALAFVCLACQKHFPTAPSTLASGVIIYEHANFLGESALVEKDVTDLNSFKGPCEETHASGQPGLASTSTFSWKNCVSSIRLAPGWKASVYTDTSFDGKSFAVSADIPNLQLVPGDCNHGGLNDCIESIRVAAQ